MKLLVFIFLFGGVSHLSAQQITGRFYPEKQRYLVGEPIVVIFEIVNNSGKAVKVGDENCASLNPDQFEVDNAPAKRAIKLYGCGTMGMAGNCLGSLREIPAGGEYRKRFLLEGSFELDSPGTYHIRAKRKQIETNGIGVNLDVASEFDIELRTPNPGELEVAYQPFLDDLHSRNIVVQSFAARAVSQNPPSFAEGALLTLSNDSEISTLSIEGLKHLADTTARLRLLEMASTASPEYVRLPAIQALGEIGNPKDCGAMLAIAAGNNNYTQAEAYIVAGRICKESAVPKLTRLVTADNSQLLMGVAGGLANTSSRRAVSPLIGLLQNRDRNTRQAAADGLATLIHRTAKHGIEDEDSAKQSYAEWSKWWSINRRKTLIYSPDQCAAPQPLS